MYEEVISALVTANIITSMAGTAALWRKIDGINARLTRLEAEHRIYTAGETRGHA